MAKQAVYNPFTGNFDLVDVMSIVSDNITFHHASAAAVSGLPRVHLIVSLAFQTIGLGVIDIATDGLPIIQTNVGSDFMFLSNPVISDDSVTVEHLGTASAHHRVYVRSNGENLYFCADMGGAGDSFFEDANGTIYPVIDDPDAAHGYPVHVDTGGSLSESRFVATLTGVNVSGGGEFESSVGSSNSLRGVVINHEASLAGKEILYINDGSASASNGRLVADFTASGNTNDRGMETSKRSFIEATSLITTFNPFIDEDADDEARLVHNNPFIQRNFHIPVGFVNKFLICAYDPNAGTNGVPFYWDDTNSEIQFTSPTTSDATVYTSTKARPIQE